MRRRARTKDSAGAAGGGLTAVVVAATALVTAPAVGAVSDIDNKLWFSDLSLTPNQTVTVKADTEFGWSWIPNPYTSNFRNHINARHLNKPSIYSENCEDDSYYYVNSDSAIGDAPSYRFDCDTFWVQPTVTKHVYSTVKSKSTSNVTRAQHRQGHYSCGSVASCGGGVEVYTSFSAK